jgi:capsular polysaccharide biosynthesis protein
LSNVDFVSLEAWSRRAAEHFPLGIEPFAVKGSGGGKVRISPSAALFRNLTVSGRNWTAMTSDRKCTLEAMVHEPRMYGLGRRNKRDALAAPWTDARTVEFLAQPSILVGGTVDYYHWLVDHLPRLLLARAKGLLADRMVLLNRVGSQHQEQSLDLLGLPSRQRYHVGAEVAVFCSDVIVPTMMARASVTHPCVLAMLRTAFLSEHREGTRRLFIASAPSGSDIDRRPVNELDVFAFLEPHGFEMCDPSSMTFKEQVDLFADAQLVVGAHSSWMANIAFAPSRTQVIELHPPDKKQLSMFMLSLVLGHSHAFVRGEADQDGWRANLPGVSEALDERLRMLSAIKMA